MTRFALDGTWRRPGGGSTLIAGSPLRVLTLGAAGARVAEALEAGSEPPPGHAPLTDRLIDIGALHPSLDPTPLPADEVTIVVPARATTPHLRPRRCRAIVVDDASPQPLVLPADLAAELVRLDDNRGPGGARAAGLDRVTTPYVAFVDADVDIAEDDLLALGAHLRDERTVLVAPRVRSGDADRTDALAQFERARSPLDLGSEPARIAPTTRVSYVPAAVLVCRTDAVRAVGGFDVSLRYGEDVDLVWRLTAAGGRCRYEPAIIAHHDTRPDLRSWLLQRYRYGTSAAPLAARHPGAVAPVRMSGWSAAAWAPVVAGVPLLGGLVAAGTAVALVRRLRSVPATESLRLVGLGHLHAGRLLAATLTRAWWPVAVLAALCSRRARRLLALAAAVNVVSSWSAEHPTLDPFRYGALRLADDIAYGAGVWVGSVHARRIDAIAPSFEAWPPRHTPSPPR
jgi:mycofactocin system glycosyltransferase